ncbi:MAG: cyclic nucleotide-binding domain-containing protein [Desulfobacterales bacterium]
MNETEILGRVSLFSHLKNRDLKRIAKLSRQCAFPKGEKIISEGERDGSLFVIVSGEVEVVKNLGLQTEKCLRRLGPLSYCGEMALIDDLIRSASVIAREDTRALCIDQWDLRQEIVKHPVLAIELLQMLNRRLRALEKSFVNTIGTFLPICANCKKIKDHNGTWMTIEEFIADHTDLEFSHQICPDCTDKLCPAP